MRKRLTSAARSAIRMRSKEADRNQALRSLERDMINGPLHCFDHHHRCCPDFCTTAKERLQLPSSSSNDREDESNEIHGEDDSALGKWLMFFDTWSKT